MFILLFYRDLIVNKCKTIFFFNRLPLPLKKRRVFGKLHRDIITKNTKHYKNENLEFRIPLSRIISYFKSVY